MVASGAGKCTFLSLLDLSAAFDTVYPYFRVDTLRDQMGISGTKVASSLESLCTHVCPGLRSLGVMFDQTMLLCYHIKTMTCSCSFHLKNIAKI